jgi:hypothetical protein
MNWWYVAIVSMALGSGVSADAPEARTARRVRPLDRWAEETLDRGLERSALIRSLVDLLEQSDLIVHVQTVTTLPPGTAGQLRFSGDVGLCRYARVQLQRSLPPDERAAILAHELQHALEVAQSPVRDHDALRELYERIGRHAGGASIFDTTAARVAGIIAWFELRRLPLPAHLRTVAERD